MFTFIPKRMHSVEGQKSSVFFLHKWPCQCVCVCINLFGFVFRKFSLLLKLSIFLLLTHTRRNMYIITHNCLACTLAARIYRLVWRLYRASVWWNFCTCLFGFADARQHAVFHDGGNDNVNDDDPYIGSVMMCVHSTHPHNIRILK